MQQKKVVSIVDPDESIGDALSILLDTYHVGVEAFASVKDLLEAHSLKPLDYDCILVSARLPETSGISLVRKIRANGLSMPLILMVGTYEHDLHLQALQSGATEIIEKSLVGSYLIERLAKRSNSSSSPQNLHGTDGSELFADPKSLKFRMMLPEDAGIEQEFIRNLTPAAKQFRFLASVREISASLLYQFTHTVFPASLALIATTIRGGRECQVAVARYAPTAESDTAEFAVVVDEQWQGQGIASKLLRGLIAAACIGGINRLEGMVLRENVRMLALAHDLGFLVVPFEGDRSVVCVSKELRGISIEKNHVNEKKQFGLEQ